MSRRVAVVVGVLLPALVSAVMAARPAFACSCAQATLAEIVAREPDAAVGVVRRIDQDGGVAGIGQVMKTLHGTLPEQVPLHLDDGGSCRPHLGVGQVGTLSFQPSGADWQTMDCGLLDAGSSFAAAFGAIEPDADARGDPAVVLTGALPGATLVALDRNLAVLATATLRGADEVSACGDNVLVSAARGRWTHLSLRSLPDLGELQTRRLDERDSRVLDVRCMPDGKVVAVTRSEGNEIRAVVYPDVFDGRPQPLPIAEDAAIVGREILLLRSTPDARHSVLSSFDLKSGKTKVRRTFDDLAMYSVQPSPDGAHVLVRGYGDQSVLLVLETGSMAIVGRTTGAWMPPESNAWIGDDLLLLTDEERAYGAAPAPARLVNARLGEVGRIGLLAPSRLVGGHGLVIGVGSAELAVARPDGAVRTSPDVRLSAAWNAVALRRVAAAEGGAASEVALPQTTIAEPRPRGLLVPTAVAVAVVAAALGAFLLRRRRAP